MKQTNEKISKIFKRISSAILPIFITAMVLAAGYFMYCSMNSKVAFVGKYATVRIITPSMEPTIPTGTYIIVEKIGPDSVNEGDVILFYSRDIAIYGKINTHRVVEIVEDNGKRQFITRGDNNPVKDAYPVHEEDVIGRYVRNSDALTAFAGFFSKPYVFFLAVFIPCALLIVFGIKDVVKKLREARMEKLIEEEVQKLKEEDIINNGKDSTDDVQKD